jgi:hypothetical protein
MTICATLGPLYFLGICAGYLIFATVIPEFRLAFAFGGLFVTLGMVRLMGLRFAAYPTRHGMMIYGLYAAIVVIQLIWYLPIANAGGKEQYMTLVGDTIVASGILAMTGEAFGALWVNGRRRAVLIRVFVAYAACVATLTLGIVMGWDATAEMRLMFQNVTTEGVMTYNYLALGDSIALLALMLLAVSRTLPVRLAILIGTAVALFFAFSRTSFFLFLICSTLVFLIGAKNSQRIGLAVAFVMLGAVAVTAFSESQVVQPALERMAVLVTDRTQDDSYMARRELLQENLTHLRENWFMGRFMDQWWRFGENSGYIHNWLSFWQSYGLLPFVASLVIFGLVAHNLWLELLKPRFVTGGAMAMFAYGMIAIITSRSFNWAFVWFTLGVVAAAVGSRLRRGPA